MKYKKSLADLQGMEELEEVLQITDWGMVVMETWAQLQADSRAR